jgi:hypothetical protein
MIYLNLLGKLKSQIIWFDVNTAIWLVDPPGEKLVILDNLGWYCDVTNIFSLLSGEVIRIHQLYSHWFNPILSTARNTSLRTIIPLLRFFNMSTCGLLFQWANTIKMVWYLADIISLKCNLFLPMKNCSLGIK